MTRVLHVLVGAGAGAEHGVVRHGRTVAEACGHDVAPFAAAADVVVAPGHDVVHLPWTDRLFGATLEEARSAFDRVAALVAEAGAALSVTLHDVPHDDSPLQLRRRELYAHVTSMSRGVVVNSELELRLIAGAHEGVRSLRMIRLPVLTPRPVGARTVDLPPHDVTVLGFVYPDRGYDEVLAALPEGATLVALGGVAAGHDDLAERYRVTAGGRWHPTGYVPDDLLPAYLAAATVPVAPNRRVTASASIDTWLAYGRRPLVPDSPYVRELLADRPGTMTVYRPGGLRPAIAAALRDPSLTRLPEGAYRGPSLAETAAAYREHLAACVPPAAHRVGDHWAVPDDRWDLLPRAAAPPRVSVVVPYFENQRGLDLVLTALAEQTHPADRLEVCVVDDGSRRLPDVSAAGSLPVHVVSQGDAGFRAARARNLGVAATTGDVVVFLDADTVPEPGFVADLVAPVAADPDVVAVGRRRHADLADVSPEQLSGWWRAGTRPAALPEPQWLADAYDRTHDLVGAGRRGYRFVISAVLAISRALFTEVGGFDERFVGYGGEDWELAHRARTAGGVLAHVRTAVAWHDGPDWATRGDGVSRDIDAERQRRRLADLLPDPDERGANGGRRYPSVVVLAPLMDEPDARRVAASAADADCGIWFGDAPPRDVLDRAWCRVVLRAPRDLEDVMALAAHAERVGRVELPGLTVHATRSLRRRERWRRAGASDDVLAALFGRHDVAP